MSPRKCGTSGSPEPHPQTSGLRSLRNRGLGQNVFGNFFMPSEEVFPKLERHEQRIEVIKTYDSAFAKEASEEEEMDEEAKAVLGPILDRRRCTRR